MSSKSARACVVWATAHSSSKFVIGVQVLGVQPKCQVPDVKAVTSALDGVIGVLHALSIVVMLMCLVVGFCLSLLMESVGGKTFQFYGGGAHRPPQETPSPVSPLAVGL